MTVALTVKVHNRDRIAARILAQREAAAPDGPAVRVALMRAAVLLQSQIKLEIRKQRLIDEGRLLNSIKWEYYKPPGGGIGIRVGSFGVPYAAVWEFGLDNYKENVRAHTRTIQSAFGKTLDKPVTVNVAAFVRTRNVRARPYIQPAFLLQQDRIVGMIQDALAAQAQTT